MQYTRRDTIATLLVAFIALVVFAKLHSYTWWLIGSWKGALSLVAVTGFGVLASYASDFIKSASVGVAGEFLLWVVTGTVIIGSFFSTTTKAEFIWSAVFIGASWLTPLVSHLVGTAHLHNRHYVHLH